MKPLLIEFQAFGPYPSKEVVDFEHLATKGLFLICGETGSGKTMLLDAMTFALYGISSGDGRNNFEANRCTNADLNTPTYVKFVFETAGNVYWFERRLTPKVSRTGKVDLSASYSMKKRVNGEWKPLLENTKANDLTEKAEELIGLKADQFRQVIILPQGKFEKLLTSNSSEKESILMTIFGEEMWSSIATYFYEETNSRLENLKRIEDRIENLLSEEGCESVEQLSTLITCKRGNLEELVSAYNEEEISKEREELQQGLMVAKRFEDLHKLEARRIVINQEKPVREQKSERLELAMRAEKVREYIDELTSAKRETDRRKSELEQAQTIEQATREKETKAGENLALHLENQQTIEEENKQIVVLEGSLGIYESIDRIQKEHDECIKTYEQAKAEETKALKICESLEPVVTAAKDIYEKLISEHELLLNAYLNSISGVLAKDLKDGQPCPVCGSLSHPKKAELMPDSVSKKDVDAKKNQADESYNVLQQQMEKREAAQKLYDEKVLIVSEAYAKLTEAETNLSNSKSSLIEGINSLDELKKKIVQITEKVSVFQDKKKTLESMVAQARDTHTEAMSKISSAKEELDKAEKRLELANTEAQTIATKCDFKSLEEARGALLDDEERNDLQSYISTYDADANNIESQISELQEELSGKEEVEVSICKDRLDELNKHVAEYAKNQALLKGEIDRLEQKLNGIQKDGKGIKEALIQATEDNRFAKRLRGETGTGLQRYVLGIMFSSVVAAANKMLELVHNGRYVLYRTDDKSDNSKKSGLELKVYDKYSSSEKGRFVNTLSGGEKFLVSLALSIGMSTIAQKSGIKIEALFIDEGFGSLDENSIVDAMSVLETVQEANGLVGIISHVQLLQDRIPTKLKVNKNEGKSHIVMSVG